MLPAGRLVCNKRLKKSLIENGHTQQEKAYCRER